MSNKMNKLSNNNPINLAKFNKFKLYKQNKFNIKIKLFN